jgi:hypothetical protein
MHKNNPSQTFFPDTVCVFTSEDQLTLCLPESIKVRTAMALGKMRHFWTFGFSCSVEKCVLLSDTGRIYIKGYLNPILYTKISKKDISYPFLEQDILRI